MDVAFRKVGDRLVGVSLIVIAGLLSTAALGTGCRYFTRRLGREVRLVAVKWSPGPEPLRQEAARLGFEISSKEMEDLRSLGLHGRVSFAASSGSDEPGKPLILLVLQKRIEKRLELFQPAGGTVIYLQGDDGSFRRIPSDAEMSQRTIRLWPDDRNPRGTRYDVEGSDGSRAGGTLFVR